MSANANFLSHAKLRQPTPGSPPPVSAGVDGCLFQSKLFHGNSVKKIRASFARFMLQIRMRTAIAAKFKLIPFLAVVLVTLVAPRLSAQTFRPDKLAAMDAAIETAIASNKCPGGGPLVGTQRRRL